MSYFRLFLMGQGECTSDIAGAFPLFQSHGNERRRQLMHLHEQRMSSAENDEERDAIMEAYERAIKRVDDEMEVGWRLRVIQLVEFVDQAVNCVIICFFVAYFCFLCFLVFLFFVFFVFSFVFYVILCFYSCNL